MPGRSDNNKNSSSGESGSKQSGQGIDRASNPGRSDHERPTGGKPSDGKEKSRDHTNSDTGLKKENQ